MITPPPCAGDESASVHGALAVKSFPGGVSRPPIVLIDQSGLRARGIGYSRSHQWRLEAEGRFPQRVKLGNGRVTWIADEVDAYLRGLAAQRSSITVTPKSAVNKSHHKRPETARGLHTPRADTQPVESRPTTPIADLVEVKEVCDAA
jgi:predicted DNA-binding transcriptional regulator AlpA